MIKIIYLVTANFVANVTPFVQYEHNQLIPLNDLVYFGMVAHSPT